MEPIYLDFNATTPLDRAAAAEMRLYIDEEFGNPSSSHSFGIRARQAVELARKRIASLLNCIPDESVFTSGGTESNNYAIKGAAFALRHKGNHIITCNIEHKAVLDSCKHLEKEGAEVTYLKVKDNGLVDLAELEAAIKPTTILIALMYANNEIGTVMPMKEISAIAKKKGILVFSDATQAVGKIPVDVTKDGIDLMAFSAHKMYGPKGVGALYVRRKNPRVKVTAQIDGGGHERGMRSGTLNVPGIVGFGKACEICLNEMEEETKRVSKLRDKLEIELLKIEE